MPILNLFKNIISRSVFIVFISSIIYSQNVIIKGVIRNPADKPVKKANVTLRNLKDEIMFEDFTNRKGEFEFEDVEPKFYYLVVEHEGDGSIIISLGLWVGALPQNSWDNSPWSP